MTESRQAKSETGKEASGDLSVTALYTAQTWRWGQLTCSEYFETQESRIVFKITNIALAVARLFIWRLRSLRVSLLHRHCAIDHLVEAFVPVRVVELAAGLSRRGVSMSASEALDYVEVDLEPVVAKKLALLGAHPDGQKCLERENWRCVSGDVQELELYDVVGQTSRSAVIAEGLFMYFGEEEQMAMWRKIYTSLRDSRAGLFVFDLVPKNEQPKPGPIGRALEWLMKRFTGGRAFEVDGRTRADIVSALASVGFDRVTALEPKDYGAQWSLPYPDYRSQQLLFICEVGESTSDERFF
ncbi:MAG: class I SAM-dependent methyltransferase [Bradymonadia bacterium]